MTALRMISLWTIILFVLVSCEQEELQNTSFSSLDAKSDIAIKGGEKDRKYEVINIKSPNLDRDGYQRVKVNKATGNELYARVERGEVVGYQIRFKDILISSYSIANRGGQCPDIWVCIHPETGKLNYYDKCITQQSPCEPLCSELTWCIHPETGEYLLYDKCTMDDPCRGDIPPIITVAKKYMTGTFCPTTDYTWMIDPNTGEYLLLQECDFGSQLFVPVGW